MHTVRNRVASRPRPPRASIRGKPPRSKASAVSLREPSFLLRQANPPAFPDHLILPAPRGAVIASIPWPEAPATPSSKKPRKVAKGKSAKRRPTTARKASRKKSANRTRAPAKRASAAATAALPSTEAPAAMTTIDLLDRALALEPEVPEALPQRHSATASATVAEPTPLPRSHAPMRPRGSGLLEVISQWFHSLAAWRRMRRDTAQKRSSLARANARQRALQSQFEALEALQSQTQIQAQTKS